MERCQGKTRKGRQCNFKALPRSVYCRQHQPESTERRNQGRSRRKMADSAEIQWLVGGIVFTVAGLATAGIGVLSWIKPVGDITWPGGLFFLVVGLLLAAFS